MWRNVILAPTSFFILSLSHSFFFLWRQSGWASRQGAAAGSSCCVGARRRRGFFRGGWLRGLGAGGGALLVLPSRALPHHAVSVQILASPWGSSAPWPGAEQWDADRRWQVR